MRLTIEKALEWAYRDELPREQVDVDRLIMEGLGATGMADASGPLQRHLANPSEAINVPLNRWGVVGVNDMFGRGPCADAIQIGLAVDALAAEAVTLAGTAMPLAGDAADEDGLWRAAYEKAARRLPSRLRDVLVRRALAGDPGHWQEDPIRRVPVLHDNGKPRWYRMVERETHLPGQFERCEVIVQKRDLRRHADCYQKFRLEPDPSWVIEARAVHAAWCAALDVLYFDLVGRMERITLLPSEVDREPWIVKENQAPERKCNKPVDLPLPIDI